MTTYKSLDEIPADEGEVSVLVTISGNGEVKHLEVVDGRFSPDLEVCDRKSADPEKCETTTIHLANRNGGDSIEITEFYDSGTLFIDNFR